MMHPLTTRREKLILAAICSKALTCREIAKAAFASEPYIRNVLVRMVAERRIYIASWHLRSHTHAAGYRAGQGITPPRPTPMTPTEGQRVYRKRIREDREANEVFLARRRAKERARVATSKPNHWFAALPGSRAIQQGAQS